MPLTIGTQRALLRKQTYIKKVLGYNPIAYWPLNEKSGTVARCLVNPAQNGTYARDVSVMTTGTGIGDGNTAPLFDGVNDNVNNFSLTYAGAFNALAGTAMMWARVANAGVWTDGNNRFLMFTTVPGIDDYVSFGKPVNNTIRCRYAADVGAGAVVKTVDISTSSAAWMCIVSTWSIAADEFRVYFNGSQYGLTQTVLTAWDEVMSLSYIGDYTLGAPLRWSGNIAHHIVWNRVLSPAEIAALAVI